jgi:thioredoxin-like negative regulator of GroEL
MDKLADEYRGKAIIAKFMLMTPYFVVTSSEIKSRYDISFFPTAILFVNGQPVNRWSLHYKIEDYRHALDAALANPPRGGPSARP